MASDDHLKADVNSILDSVENREAASDALAFLFPKLARLIGKSISPDDIVNRVVDRRISKAQFSKNYFSLSPDLMQPSKQKLEAMIAAGPADFFTGLAGIIESAGQNEKLDVISQWLDFLEAILPHSESASPAWFSSLLEFVTKLSVERDWRSEPIFGPSLDERSDYILLSFLRNLDESQRYIAVDYAIEHAADLSFLCVVFRRIAGDITPDGVSQRTDFFDAKTANELRRKLADRVKALASVDLLLSQIKPGSILWFWWGSGHSAEVREYAHRAMKTGIGKRCMFAVPITVVRSTGGNYEHVDRQTWNKIIDIDDLERHANATLNQSDDPAYSEARRFVDALKRGDGGFTTAI